MRQNSLQNITYIDTDQSQLSRVPEFRFLFGASSKEDFDVIPADLHRAVMIGSSDDAKILYDHLYKYPLESINDLQKTIYSYVQGMWTGACCICKYPVFYNRIKYGEEFENYIKTNTAFYAFVYLDDSGNSSGLAISFDPKNLKEWVMCISKNSYKLNKRERKFIFFTPENTFGNTYLKDFFQLRIAGKEKIINSFNSKKFLKSVKFSCGTSLIFSSISCMEKSTF